MKAKLKRYALMLAGFVIGGVVVVVAGAGMVVGSVAGVAYVGFREGFRRTVEGMTKNFPSDR